MAFNLTEFIDLIDVSQSNMRHAGVRTFLTLIGVVIGIAAIVSLLSIGDGLNVAVAKQFEQLGSNTIFVIPGSISQGNAPIKLSDGDITRMEGTRGVSIVTPIYTGSAKMEFNGQTVNAQIMAVDAVKAKIFSDSGFFNIAEGRELERNDSAAILIGDSIAHDYFDKDITVRKKVILGGQEYTVAGILKSQSQSVGGGGPNQNGAIFMTLDAFKRIATPTSPAIVFVKTQTADDVTDSAAAIKDYFEKKYGKKSVNVQTAKQILEQINMFLSLITIFIAGIGGISIVVGGIGITNAMITSVLERTKEIGLLKALGASDGKVLTIFLLEAGIIGLVGGVIGILLGYSFAVLIGFIGQSAGFNLIAAMSPELTIGALLFSMLIGMGSGFFPALRASKMDPVVALRYE